MKTETKRTWAKLENLSAGQQRVFLTKAQYLVDKGYPVGKKGVYELAEILYNNSI